MVTDNLVLGVGIDCAKGLKGLWEIALLGLGISAHLAVFDLTMMAFVRGRLHVSFFSSFLGEQGVDDAGAGLDDAQSG